MAQVDGLVSRCFTGNCYGSGTAAIGRVVDNSLEAFAAKGLFVCDASVFPRSPGRPPTLTIIALAKYLAKTL